MSRLANAGYRLAVLSNGDPGMLATVNERAGLLDRFEAVISADAVATYKPAPAVYEHAADRLGEPLGDCMRVSSNAWDVAGAAQAGMAATWVNRAGDPPERIGGVADLEVPSLGGVAEALA